MQILLADDQPQVRSALRLLLELEPEFKIVGEVDDASDLLNSVEANNPDLLFLDWELPGFSQDSFLPRLRRNRPGLSIIALSGHFEARQVALNAGVEAFVSKTHPPQELISVLHRVRRTTQQKTGLDVVEDWMTPDVIAASTEATALDAYRQMTRYHVRRLPVVDDDSLVGIVTLGDIRRVRPSSAKNPSVPEVNCALSKLNITKVMNPQPITVTPLTPIAHAASIMLNKRISGLPVVDNECNVIGVITESDIFRMIVRSWRNGQNLAI